MSEPYTMRILGITGRLKSGKDTAYEILKKQLAPLPVVRLGFADALKEDICRLVGCDRVFLDKHKDNFRLMMQAYGTDVRRKLWGEDYWIKRLAERIGIEADRDVPPYLLCITDVRFKNEARFVQQLGGKVWRIERVQQGDTSTHLSETELDSIVSDETVHNDSSMVSFEHEVQLAWMRSFCSRNNTTICINQNTQQR